MTTTNINDEPEEYCIFCDNIFEYHNGYECESCDACFCEDCFQNEDLVTQTISPDFCKDLIACDERRLKLFINDPSRYRNCEDEAKIIDFIMIMTKCSMNNASVAINITDWHISDAIAMLNF